MNRQQTMAPAYIYNDTYMYLIMLWKYIYG